MSGRLADRVALVTGAARGIGEAIARRLAEEGATVAMADIDSAEAAAQQLRSEGWRAWAYRVDIADVASVQALAVALDERFGQLDIVVNNAAILDATALGDLTMARFRHVLDVNLEGAVRVTLASLPLLRRGGAARRIVNIASIMGLRGQPDSLPYSTAKGGLVNFTRALACDVAQAGITVNALAPGFIDTRMALLPDGSGHEHETAWFKDIYLKYGRILLGRPGLAEDIAGPAFFLCSDDSAYVTGQVLLVDGGVSATF